MERVKVPARIVRAGMSGSEKCGEIPKTNVAGSDLLVWRRTLDEKPLVVGGEVHDTADERLIREGKCPILITFNLPIPPSNKSPGSALVTASARSLNVW